MPLALRPYAFVPCVWTERCPGGGAIQVARLRPGLSGEVHLDGVGSFDGMGASSGSSSFHILLNSRGVNVATAVTAGVAASTTFGSSTVAWLAVDPTGLGTSSFTWVRYRDSALIDGPWDPDARLALRDHGCASAPALGAFVSPSDRVTWLVEACGAPESARLHLVTERGELPLEPGVSIPVPIGAWGAAPTQAGIVAAPDDSIWIVSERDGGLGDPQVGVRAARYGANGQLLALSPPLFGADSVDRSVAEGGGVWARAEQDSSLTIHLPRWDDSGSSHVSSVFRVSPGGSIVWSWTSAPNMVAYGERLDTAVAPGLDGGLLLALGTTSGRRALWVVSIGADGRAVSAPMPDYVMPAVDATGIHWTSIASDGRGGFYLALRREHLELQYYAGRGDLRWTSEGYWLTGAGPGNLSGFDGVGRGGVGADWLDLVQDGDGGVWLLQQETAGAWLVIQHYASDGWPMFWHRPWSCVRADRPMDAPEYLVRPSPDEQTYDSWRDPWPTADGSFGVDAGRPSVAVDLGVLDGGVEVRGDAGTMDGGG